MDYRSRSVLLLWGNSRRVFGNTAVKVRCLYIVWFSRYSRYSERLPLKLMWCFYETWCFTGRDQERKTSRPTEDIENYLAALEPLSNYTVSHTLHHCTFFSDSECFKLSCWEIRLSCYRLSFLSKSFLTEDRKESLENCIGNPRRACASRRRLISFNGCVLYIASILPSTKGSIPPSSPYSSPGIRENRDFTNSLFSLTLTNVAVSVWDPYQTKW